MEKSERRENILSVLTNNRNRFKCGREIKKRTTIWGLRVRLPPPAPCANLPPSGRIIEEELREMWQGNRRLQFLPVENNTEQVKVIVDTQMKSLMMGAAYLQISTHSESDSPCPSPEIICEEPPLEQNPIKKTQKHEYLGAGKNILLWFVLLTTISSFECSVIISELEYRRSFQSIFFVLTLKKIV